jgi:hypothetical protein
MANLLDEYIKEKYRHLREKCKLSDREKEELVVLCNDDIVLLEGLANHSMAGSFGEVKMQSDMRRVC